MQERQAHTIPCMCWFHRDSYGTSHKPTSLDATRSAGLFKGHMVRSQGSIVVLLAPIPWWPSSLGLGMFGATKLKGALGHTDSWRCRQIIYSISTHKSPTLLFLLIQLCLATLVAPLEPLCVSWACRSPRCRSRTHQPSRRSRNLAGAPSR